MGRYRFQNKNEFDCPSMDHGITSWVSIKSLAGEPCIVQIMDWNNLPKMSNPAIGIKAWGNGRFELQLKKVHPSLISRKQATKFSNSAHQDYESGFSLGVKLVVCILNAF